MSIFARYRQTVVEAVASLVEDGLLPSGLPLERITVEPPREAAHGDIATNAAMVLAGAAKMKPRALAERLAGRLAAAEGVSAADVAGPGFVNVKLHPDVWRAEVAVILAAGTRYGDTDLGQGEAVNIEYVSANPTGPMHVGHGRGAVVGDALAALLEKAGYRVTREYYINDAGAQVTALARSLRERYLVAAGARPAGHFETLQASGGVEYGGDYLVPVAEALAARDGTRWVDAAAEAWLPVLRAFAVERMMALIRDDLAAVGIRFAVMTSEQALVARGAVDEALALLDGKGLLYEGVLAPPKGKLPDDWEPRPQTLFRATQFGDEVDRPLRKSDGSWTYFAVDLAYHLDKFRRGFRTLIDVWGADHGGYVKRMQAAVAALTDGGAGLDVKLCQLVSLLDGGEPVRMSKRAGTFVTLREVVDRVGRDVFRFIMLTRKNDAALDFDFQAVLEQSKDNPVFYVQYAHARCCSVLRHAAVTLGPAFVADAALAAAPLVRLTDDAELALIRTLAGWPRTVEGAALAHEPHRIAFYLQELASMFHLLWTKGKEDAELRFLIAGDEALTGARLALVRATALVIASGLQVMGVQPVEELR